MSTFSPDHILIENTLNHDKYGLKDRGTIKTREIEPVFYPMRASLKKKIAKNRGIIVKDDRIEIGYLVDSLHFRRRFSLFITFLTSTIKAKVTVKENSLKFWKNVNLSFENQKKNEQFKSVLDI